MATLLDLDGAQLEKELQKIIRENQPRYKLWTEKENAILKRLIEAGVPSSVIAKKMGRSRGSVTSHAESSSLRQSSSPK